MYFELLSNYLELFRYLLVSLILTPIFNVLAAPGHLVYVVSILFVLDVYVGISSDQEGFSLKKFRRIFPKFFDVGVMIILMSSLAALHDLTAPLQVTGYILVSFWLASSIVENKIKKDPNPNNPWRRIRDELKRFTQWYSRPKPPKNNFGADA